MDGKEKRHIWDGQNMVLELNDHGAIAGRYLRGNGLIARIIDGKQQYYLHNSHGDVTHLSDASGGILKRYIYGAFGVEENSEELDNNHFRYCGEYYDKETKTIYLRARNYNPRTGRFTSEDPIKDGNNWYAYCGGNPVKFVDPSGKSLEDWASEFGKDAKQAWRGFESGYENRYRDLRENPNFATFSNYITSGMTGANGACATEMMNNTSPRSVINWVTSGGADLVDAIGNPEKPFSFDHIVSSAAGALIVFGGVKAIQAYNNTAPSIENFNPKPTNPMAPLVETLDDLIDDPGLFKNASPEEWYQYLQDSGYSPQPLSGGALKGISFSDGGGFKVNWGGDRILMYHPSGLNHHGGAYWKLSSGPTGTLRYDLYGNIITT